MRAIFPQAVGAPPGRQKALTMKTGGKMNKEVPVAIVDRRAHEQHIREGDQEPQQDCAQGTPLNLPVDDPADRR